MTAPSPARASPAQDSIVAEDVARFSAIAEQWWDPKGKFAPLHRLNPARLAFIRDAVLNHFGGDPYARRPFDGLRLLDIGCGGGLLCEPMARLGFAVTGVDASERNIAIASAHAAAGDLAIDYRAGTAEGLLAEGEAGFDVVLNMEVIEHVADPGAFLRDSVRLLKPAGVMVLATLNRTLPSLALAKLAAEHLLRWLPPGTHDWRKFLRPEEIRGFLAREALVVEGPFGLAYDPLSGRWSQGQDARINYMMIIARPPAPVAG
jgi:2-polyprenyl-6-hydroxyphenyl methylase / 3-demethylubiquinone-9 3-methyltransferase